MRRRIPGVQIKCGLWLGVFALLGACTQGVRLSGDDRAQLAGQPAIQMLNYETPLPRIKSGVRNPPTPGAVHQHAAADPATLIAQGFGRLLGKKEKLKNLRTETRPQPRPVADNARHYRDKYRRGLVLELWVDEWGFTSLPADTQSYAMTLKARSRLSRVEDGGVLWSTGRCHVDGNNSNREHQLAGKELTGGIKLRKLLAAARDECARQLMRDFDARG